MARQTDLERSFEMQLETARITGWEKEYHFKIPGSRNPCRFDFAWPDIMLAIDIQGGIFPMWHTTKTGKRYKMPGAHLNTKGYIHDCEKANEASVCGWTVLWVTPKHLDCDWGKKSTSIQWVERFLINCCGNSEY